MARFETSHLGAVSHLVSVCAATSNIRHDQKKMVELKHKSGWAGLGGHSLFISGQCSTGTKRFCNSRIFIIIFLVLCDAVVA